jgi:hypothetical protein
VAASLRAVSIALAVTLLLRSAAFAECAWVLWREASYADNTGTRTEWSQDGYATSQECYEQIRAREAHMRSTGWRVGAFYESPKGAPLVVVGRFTCLPDTVDPRGPKGR